MYSSQSTKETIIMSHNYDGAALYQFLTQTPESGLRKLLIEGAFTQNHFNLLMKLVRQTNEEAFAKHFSALDFPKLKYNATEINLKEKFWNDCIKVCNQRGLLSEIIVKAAA